MILALTEPFLASKLFYIRKDLHKVLPEFSPNTLNFLCRVWDAKQCKQTSVLNYKNILLLEDNEVTF